VAYALGKLASARQTPGKLPVRDTSPAGEEMAMRVQSSLLKSAVLLSIAALLAAGSAALAQDDHAAHAGMVMPAEGAPAPRRAVRWSDPAAWPDGRVPRAGDAVTIARNVDMTLDVSPPAQPDRGGALALCR
jgi:hypothetical protein